MMAPVVRLPIRTGLPGRNGTHWAVTKRGPSAAPYRPEDDDHGGGNIEDEGEQEHDIEIEQMLHDVPSLQTFALEPDHATGKRQFLGINNLQPSFQDNGGGVRCAETGRIQYRNHRTGEVRFDRRWTPEELCPSKPAPLAVNDSN